MANAPPPAAVTRDEDTVAMWTEFLDEANDHLSKADVVLLAAGELGADQVNALFRGFHSIKGLAGFCGLEQVQRLAHATEELLNRARSGAMQLTGPTRDAVLLSTGEMRRLLGEVTRALTTGTAIQVVPGTEEVAQRLGALLGVEGRPAAAPTGIPSPSASAPAAAGAATAVAPAPSEEPPADRPALRLRETLRVDVERVERLVEMIGELVIVQSMVPALPEIVAASAQTQRRFAQLAKISREVQDAAMRIRMTPIRDVFQRMGRVVWDVARKVDKKVQLTMAGDHTELDRSLIERLEGPLLHMIRNAVDHGIEPDAERVAAGKPTVATVHLAASCEGSSIVITVGDDGRGLPKEKILAKAVERGLVAPGAVLDDDAILDLIFLPGFSTAAAVTNISGRGVGMDVVRKAVEGMRGKVRVSSVPGQGTTFTMHLPLTTAIIDGLLVRSGAQRYIVPCLSVLQSDPVGASLVHRGSDEFLKFRGSLVPVVRLSKLFAAAGGSTDGMAVVVEGMVSRSAVLVDEIVGQLQVVIKPLSADSATRCFAGAAILPDGQVGLILDPDELTARGPTAPGPGPFFERAREVTA